ncbi:MAG: hypothetical protein NTV54_03005 [Ignavibacteriales bacterium]|nr:hypothetical protein [Ignavibacteriales bacterium]
MKRATLALTVAMLALALMALFAGCDVFATDGDSPSSIVPARGYFYITDRNSASIIMLDADLRELKRWNYFLVTGDSSIQGITFDGKSLWIASAGSTDKIFQVDASSDSLVVLKSIDAPPQKQGTVRGIAWDGSNLWALNSGSATYATPARLYKLDPNGAVISEFQLPSTDPRGLTYVNPILDAYGRGPVPGLYYSDVTSDKIYRFNPSIPYFDTVFSSPKPPLGASYIYPAGLTYDRTYFWLVNSSNVADHLYRISYNGREQIRYDLPYPSMGALTWAAADVRVSEQMSVMSVSPASGIPGAAFPVDIYGTGFKPGYGVAVDFGAGISVIAPQFVSISQLKVNIIIGSTAVLGKRDVKVTNPKGKFAIGTALFEVTATPKIPYLWLADQASGQYAVHKIRLTDTALVKTWATTGILSSSGAQGLAFDGTNYWMSTSGTDRRIHKIDTTGVSLASMSSFSAPAVGGTVRGIAFDGSGNIWVSLSVVTAGGGRIYKMNPANGAVLDSVATPGQNPRGIAFANNVLYCNDTDLDSVYSYTAGIWSSKFQTPTTGGASRFATGLTWDGTSFWIANSTTASDYLFKVSLTGTVLQMFRPAVAGDPQFTGLTYVSQ